MKDFFSSLSARAAKAGKQLTLNSHIGEMRHQIERELTEVGRKAYELFELGQVDDPMLREACTRIGGLQEELKRMEAELAELATTPAATSATASSACPKCGAGVEAGQAYCMKCGAAVLRCSQCGSSLAPEANFCATCGAKHESPPGGPTA